MTQLNVNPVTLEQVFAHTSDGVFALDNQRRFILFSPACERLTGYAAGEMIGSACTCGGTFNCQDEQERSIQGVLCPGMAIFRGETAAARQRMRIRTKDGGQLWVETAYTALLDENGSPQCVLGVMRDVSDAKQREDRWKESLQNFQEETKRLREQMRQRYGFVSFISRSPRMQVVLEKVHAACGTASPTLILGESGTGKEMLARTIHYNGLQKDGPFFTLSCAGTPREQIEAELFGYVRGSFVGASRDYPGLLKAADGGTLFLDDIDALPDTAQAKLLRVIQDRTVRSIGSIEQTPAQPRILAATSRSIDDLLRANAMRQDLYYRFSVLQIELSPLRLRKEDLPYLVEHFIGQLNAQSTRRVTDVEPAVWAKLDAHDWPGNVRELHNVIESAFVSGKGPVLLADEVTLARRHLGQPGGEDVSTDHVGLDVLLADIERRAILSALRRAGGQRSRAAKAMGISRSRLYRRMEALGITSAEAPPEP